VPRLPPCPIERLVALYHEFMPDNPRCRVLNDARRRRLAARWREAARLRTPPFLNGYTTVEEGLACWREFFRLCAQSDFLTGKTPSSSPNRPPFIADLDFLLSPSGFAKTLEQKYHRNVGCKPEWMEGIL
jgi:hypothetical protein